MTGRLAVPSAQCWSAQCWSAQGGEHRPQWAAAARAQITGDGPGRLLDRASQVGPGLARAGRVRADGVGPDGARPVQVRLPADSTDNTFRDGVVKSFRRADGKNRLSQANTKLLIGQRDGRQILFFDLDHRQIGIAIRSDELGFIDTLPPRKRSFRTLLLRRENNYESGEGFKREVATCLFVRGSKS